MATEVPLHVFVNCWRAAKLFDKEHSAFSQTKWMLEHWSFDNDIAHYAGYHVHCAASEVYEPIGVKGASGGIVAPSKS